jgi:hypothetical protein
VKSFSNWDLISKRWLLERFVSTWMMVSLSVREPVVALFSLCASSVDRKNFVGNTVGSAEQLFSAKEFAVLSMMH